MTFFPAESKKRTSEQSGLCFDVEGTVKIDIFQGLTKAPRSGGPKPEPSDSILI